MPLYGIPSSSAPRFSRVLTTSNGYRNSVVRHAAAPPAEVPKAAAAVDAAATKKKSRQSLSISKSAQEAMQHNMEDKQPAADAAAPPAASGGYQGLPQIGSPPSALRELPALRDAPPNKREELFKLKLQLCGVIFSFDDPTSDKRGKVCLLCQKHLFYVHRREKP